MQAQPTFIIIQARMGSTRFPKKVLEPVGGRPMLFQQVDRARRVRGVTEVLVATSEEKANDELVELCGQNGVMAYRGSENDVLKRFLEAAQAAMKKHGLTGKVPSNQVRLVRLTADCPLIDPKLIERSLEILSADTDYVGYSSTFPDGMDNESFWMSTLEKADREAKKGSEREHVTPYVWNSPAIFKLKKLEATAQDPSLSHVRLSVDKQHDLELVRLIWDAATKVSKEFGIKEVKQVLDANPQWLAINADSVRNEGYIKSIREDQMKDLPKRELKKSVELWDRATQVIPSGTQTLSKGPNQFIKGVYPMYLERGQGAYVWDVDGNKYIDYPMSLGAILLGHAHPKVVEAVTEQLKGGTLFSLMHPKEVELAERLCDMIPSAEQVRFGKNGADATSAAVRCARALTGRDDIAYCGYHGYQDWYASIHPRNKGVPAAFKQMMHEFSYNNLESLEKIFTANPGKIAAVIMEQPVIEPKEGFYQQCIDLAHKHGALFILDEIVTGFRYSTGGAQKLYGFKPDMACFGKAMGNGLPIGAVVGQRHVMKEFDNIFFSTTFGGETAALAASLAVTEAVQHDGVIDHIWETGNYWIKSFNEMKNGLGGIDVRLLGNAPRSVLEFRNAKGEVSNDIRSLFLQETVKRGILFGVPIFMTYSHTKSDIDQTVAACEAALKICKKAIEDDSIDAFMEGEKVGQLFRPQPKSN